MKEKPTSYFLAIEGDMALLPRCEQFIKTDSLLARLALLLKTFAAPKKLHHEYIHTFISFVQKWKKDCNDAILGCEEFRSLSEQLNKRLKIYQTIAALMQPNTDAATIQQILNISSEEVKALITYAKETGYIWEIIAIHIEEIIEEIISRKKSSFVSFISEEEESNNRNKSMEKDGKKSSCQLI